MIISLSHLLPLRPLWLTLSFSTRPFGMLFLIPTPTSFDITLITEHLVYAPWNVVVMKSTNSFVDTYISLFYMILSPFPKFNEIIGVSSIARSTISSAQRDMSFLKVYIFHCIVFPNHVPVPFDVYHHSLFSHTTSLYDVSKSTQPSVHITLPHSFYYILFHGDIRILYIRIVTLEKLSCKFS